MALACSENLRWPSTKTLANRTKQNIYSIIYPNRIGHIQVMQGQFNNSQSINIINHSNRSKEKSHLIIIGAKNPFDRLQYPVKMLIDSRCNLPQEKPFIV